MNGGDSSSTKTQQTNIVAASSANQVPSEFDAECEIQEFNLTIVHNQTIIPVTEEELRQYPEFEMYMHDVNTDPYAWSFGTRLVRDFECNASRTIQFLKLYRKYEEAPNQPVLEYHGHSYIVGFEYFHSHSTYVPITPGDHLPNQI